MKIFLKFPGGGEFHFQRQPLSVEKFSWLCGLCCGALAAAVFIVLIVTVA